MSKFTMNWCKQVLGFLLVFMTVQTHGVDISPLECLQDYSSEISADLNTLQILEYTSEDNLNDQHSESLDRLMYKINSTKIFLEGQQEQAKKLGNTDKCDVEEKEWQQIVFNFQKQTTTLVNDLVDQLRGRKDALVKIGNDNKQNWEKLNDNFNTCVTESCLTSVLIQCQLCRKIFQYQKLKDNFTSFAGDIENFAIDEFSALNSSEEITISKVVQVALTCLFKKIPIDFVKTEVQYFGKTLNATVDLAKKDIETLEEDELGALEESISNGNNRISGQVNETVKELDEDQIEAGKISNRSIPCDDYKKSFDEESSGFGNLTTLIYRTFSKEIQRNLDLLDAELENYKSFPIDLKNQLDNCQKDDTVCFRNIYIESILSSFNLSINIAGSKDKFIDSNIDTFNETSGKLDTTLLKSLTNIDQITITSKLCMYDFTQKVLTRTINTFQRKTQDKCINMEVDLGLYESKIMQQARGYSNRKYDQLVNDSYAIVSGYCYSYIDTILNSFIAEQSNEITFLQTTLSSKESTFFEHCNDKFENVLQSIEFCRQYNYTCLQNIQDEAGEIFDNVPQDIANATSMYHAYADDQLAKSETMFDSYFADGEKAAKDVDTFCYSGSASYQQLTSSIYTGVVITYLIKINIWK